MSYYRDQAAANAISGGASSLASLDMKKYGRKYSIYASIFYIFVIVLLIVIKISQFDEQEWLSGDGLIFTLTILFLFAFICFSNLLYYLIKNKNEETANRVTGHVSFIPIYVGAILLAVLLILGMFQVR